ncbi:MAG: hypothetical protein WBB74_09875 [Gaiellaceae bacterium]
MKRIYWLAAAILVLAVVIAVTVATSEKRQRSTTTRRVGVAGVTVVLPRGWHNLKQAVPLPDVPVDFDPVTRIVVASAPINFAANGCLGIRYAFSATAVALVVQEWIRPTPGSLPPRPQRFTRDKLPVRPPPALECWSGPGGSAEFTDHGRRFDAFVLLGRNARPELAGRARHILDTLSVTKRSS